MIVVDAPGHGSRFVPATVFQALLGLLTLLLAVGGAQAQRSNLVESLLLTGPEGWKAIDIPANQTYVASPQPFDPEWIGNDTTFGPHLKLGDTSDGTIFFLAPSNIVRRLPEASGGFLEFELASPVQSWSNDHAVVIVGMLGGTPRAMACPLGALPGPAWTRYNARLVAQSFRLDAPGGPQATRAQFREILLSATALRLPAEFGTGIVEASRLRNVRLFSQGLLDIVCVPGLTLEGAAGDQFRIEYVEAIGGGAWKPLATVTLARSPFVYVDVEALDVPRRLYRAIELPEGTPAGVP